MPDSGCGSWLFEPQSTNVLLQSNGFGTTPWSVGNSTVFSNSGISPSGINDAWEIQSTTINSETRVRQSYNYTIGNTITLSCFMKAGTVNFGIVRTYAISGGGRVWFDLLNGTIGTENTGLTGKIENYGNGWYRCSITGVIDTTGAIDFAPAPADNDFLANAVGESIYIYGGQLEINSSYATSYIPTEGSTVTRNQDVCTNGGSLASINSTEGTLYAEIASENITTFKNISINNGGITNRINLYIYSSSIVVNFDVGGVNQASLVYSIPNVTIFNKFAFSYKLNEFKLFVNGVQRAIDTSGAVPAVGTFNKLSFNDGALSKFFGKTKCLAVWKEALSDSELQSLTTI